MSESEPIDIQTYPSPCLVDGYLMPLNILGPDLVVLLYRSRRHDVAHVMRGGQMYLPVADGPVRPGTDKEESYR